MFPQNSHVVNLILNGVIFEDRALGKWLGHEGRALMNGISVLIKETPESSRYPSAMWGHMEKTAIYGPGSRSSSDTESISVLVQTSGLQNCSVVAARMD